MGIQSITVNGKYNELTADVCNLIRCSDLPVATITDANEPMMARLANTGPASDVVRRFDVAIELAASPPRYSGACLHRCHYK